MSLTYHLECNTCKKSLWIGQRSHQRSYIYTEESNTMEALDAFLFEHQTGGPEKHELHFVSDTHSKLHDGIEGWSEVSVPPLQIRRSRNANR